VPQDSLLYFEDFESYVLGESPEGWLDTRGGTPAAEDSTLFGIMEVDGSAVLGSVSVESDIYSHLDESTAGAWYDYETSGRMRIDDARGEIGVTVLSDYPHSDSYYRLRRVADGEFELASHLEQDAPVCVSKTTTGVVPEPGTWVRFRLQAFDDGDAPRLRAKVWPEGKDEPADWQADCTRVGAELGWQGVPGVWSSGDGGKYWDEIEVRSLSVGAPDDPAPDLMPAYRTTFNAEPLDSDPRGWIDTTLFSSMEQEDSLFKVKAVPGNKSADKAFGTSSRMPGIHSHYVQIPDADLYSYEFRGRMMSTRRDSGIGVTVYSDFPNSNRYYALRSHRKQSVKLVTAPRKGESECVGDLDTGIKMESMDWYAFRVQAFDSEGGTRVRAKIWPSHEPEPVGWQADCTDRSAAFLDWGVPGVWSLGRGEKFWDDLELIPLPVE